MALEKNYDYKGRTANYWKIIKTSTNLVTEQTSVELRPYWDKACRDADASDYLPERKVMFFNVVDQARAALYLEVRKSKIISQPVTVDGVVQKDEENHIITEDIESNYFADAKDIKEAGQE